MKTIVQIGVSDANDHVFDLIKEIKENIFPIFIEPNPYCIPLIKKKYEFLPLKIISNIAISNTNENKIMYFPPWFESGDAAVASLDKQHVIAHQIPENTIKTLNVNCFTLNTFLNTILGLQTPTDSIDYLFIDTEGHDCNIILSIDFSKISFDMICFEYIHSDGFSSGMHTNKMISTNKYLEYNGYYLEKMDTINHNIIYKKGNSL